MSLAAKPAWICSHSMKGTAGLVMIYAPSCRVIQGVELSFVGRPGPVNPLTVTSNLTISSDHLATGPSRPVAKGLPIISQLHFWPSDGQLGHRLIREELPTIRPESSTFR